MLYGLILLFYFRVKKDMDEPTGKLMGAHGYCTQVSGINNGRYMPREKVIY